MNKITLLSRLAKRFLSIFKTDKEYLKGTRPITLVYPYYNQPKLLAYQLKIWQSYSPEILNALEFIIVDDGSNNHPAEKVVVPASLNIHLYKITQDIPCNFAGAKNLGMSMVDSEWAIILDMDHYFDSANMEKIIGLAKGQRRAYYFSRYEAGTRSFIQPSPTALLITRRDFWKTGGYDEDFSGAYGYEDVFFNRALERRSRKKLPGDIFINVVEKLDSEYSLNRDKHRNRALYEKKTAWYKSRKNGPILRFPWEKSSFSRTG